MTQAGFCVISPWSLSRFLSNYQKALLRLLLHLHSNFNSFHEAVYPVGVTTNRSCFMRIIGRNPRTIHRICTKFDARIRLWSPFLCAKSQGDRSKCLCCIAIFASVRKHEEEGKNEEKNRNFGSSYLRNGWSNFLQIWYVDSLGWRATL